MLRIVLIRPGATDFDQQGRIKGALDIPLNELGRKQVATVGGELANLPIELIYHSPGLASSQTAELLGELSSAKTKKVDKLRNLNLGLWQGKLIDEVRQTQPRVFRRWQEHPQTVCPPEGEMIESAQKRVRRVVDKIVRKHREGGVIALVVPEPLARLVSAQLTEADLGDLWQAERDCAYWELIDVETEKPVVS